MATGEESGDAGTIGVGLFGCAWMGGQAVPVALVVLVVFGRAGTGGNTVTGGNSGDAVVINVNLGLGWARADRPLAVMLEDEVEQPGLGRRRARVMTR